MTHSVTLMIASNAPERERLVGEALSRLASLVTVDKASQPIDSADYYGRPYRYLDIVVGARTDLEADDIIATLKQIETSMGRNKADRPLVVIDLDLVTFDGIIIKQKEFESAPYRQGIASIG